MTDLSELRRLHAAATAGEWTISDDGSSVLVVHETDNMKTTGFVAIYTRERDSTWIAAIHNAFPQLAATIETQAKTIATLREQLKTAIEDIQSWGLYASEYFQNKHNLAGVIAEHQKVLEETACTEHTETN